ncbi:MAG: hypothetical protein CMI15_10215 [Opitutaceae bacterium]|nr:hypothetical protein [Opitutaceae bacterium]
MAKALLERHPYLLSQGKRNWLLGELRKGERRVEGGLPEAEFLEMLESIDSQAAIDLQDEDQLSVDGDLRFDLPGDQGGVLLRVSNGSGPANFEVSELDLSKREKTLTMPVAERGETWALLSLSGIPNGETVVYLSLDSGTKERVRVPVRLNAPEMGRLQVDIRSDDTGLPTPAMVQLEWQLDGSVRAPGSVVDYTRQFDSQARTLEQIQGSRTVAYPGFEPGHYWICDGPFDMGLPPGEWKLTILRGIEHIPVVDTISIESGKTVSRSYRPKRWVKMADRGWCSGDDHVHMQIQSDADAERMLVWAQAEDTHLVNILEMGDHERTFFQQRGFGKENRIQNGDTILVPGQEDPRIAHLGHTIALNISSQVRDTSKYYLHDWVYDSVKSVGGLHGYAHVNRGLFEIERNLSLNIPKQKVDFVELLQFHSLGTDLYYHFLNLGEKVTASAGSDVPWGGTVGEVRVYAYLGDTQFSADAWFEALERGRTFVTNGPMIDFAIDDALPGDQIDLGEARNSVRVRARAWGHAKRALIERLEIVQLGEVIRSSERKGKSSDELKLDFELDPGSGCWIAARAFAKDRSVAHTTPIYLKRPSLRFWKHEEVPELIERSLKSLQELEDVATNIETPSDMPAESGQGLIGAWHGRADRVRAKGMDRYEDTESTWVSNRPNRGYWSAFWRGTLTIPENHLPPDTIYLSASSEASVAIDGDLIARLDKRGEDSASVALDRGRSYRMAMEYQHRQAPLSYLHLSMSREGGAREPLPIDWLSFAEDDFRHAYLDSIGSFEEQRTLGGQAPQLVDRIDEARQIYGDLLGKWDAEKSLR